MEILQFTDITRLDAEALPSPCYVVDEVAVERNLAILAEVAEASGAMNSGDSRDRPISSGGSQSEVDLK